MRLKNAPKSKNVKTDIPYAQTDEWTKEDRKRQTSAEIDGKRNNERIYKTPEFRRAIEDVSSEFQSRTRTDGKGDRQNGPRSPALSKDALDKVFKQRPGKYK